MIVELIWIWSIEIYTRVHREFKSWSIASFRHRMTLIIVRLFSSHLATNNHSVPIRPPPTSSSSSSTTSTVSNQLSQSGNLKVTNNNNNVRKDKSTRMRTVLNEKQLQTLRSCYNANPRPDALMKEHLVELTQLSPRVIRVWFQNKRTNATKKFRSTKKTTTSVLLL